MYINSPLLQIPDSILMLLEKLNSAGYAAYIVGGAVRDGIMNRPCSDYDITTSALPEQIKEVFADFKTFDTGIKHGTVTVLTGEYSVEVTAFRCEGAYSDGRHPDSVSFTDDVTEDLKRRDFTVNAIAYNPKTGYVDPFGGMEDIRKKIIRCVGRPEMRFGEDKLRILRAVRFSSVLGFDIDSETSKAIKASAGEISSVSAERVFSELCKLICGKNAKRCLYEYRELLFEIIPELKAQYGFDQNNTNHSLTLFEHTLAVLGYTEPTAHMRFTALLHDAGKPETATLDENGVSHYYGHPDVSEKIARNVLSRLKASKEFTEHVCILIKYHDTRFKSERPAVRRFIGKLGEEKFFELMALKKADTMSQSPRYRYRLDSLDSIEECARKVIAEGDVLTVKDLKISGDDILAAGVAPGKAVGEMLSELLDRVINDSLKNDKESLLAYVDTVLNK